MFWLGLLAGLYYASYIVPPVDPLIAFIAFFAFVPLVDFVAFANFVAFVVFVAFVAFCRSTRTGAAKISEGREAYLMNIIFGRADVLENAIAQALWIVSAHVKPKRPPGSTCFEVVRSYFFMMMMLIMITYKACGL